MYHSPSALNPELFECFVTEKLCFIDAIHSSSKITYRPTLNKSDFYSTNQEKKYFGSALPDPWNLYYRNKYDLALNVHVTIYYLTKKKRKHEYQHTSRSLRLSAFSVCCLRFYISRILPFSTCTEVLNSLWRHLTDRSDMKREKELTT